MKCEDMAKQDRLCQGLIRLQDGTYEQIGGRCRVFLKNGNVHSLAYYN